MVWENSEERRNGIKNEIIQNKLLNIYRRSQMSGGNSYMRFH
jgi:hypothetical protein